MLSLTPTAAALIALVCGAWLAAGVWATLRGMRARREAVAQVAEVAGSEAVLAASPAIPLLIRRDGSLQASESAAFALGLTALPRNFSAELGLEPADAAALREAVAAA